MKRLTMSLCAILLALPAVAAHHESPEAEVRAALESFNTSYATNDVETYFDFYTDDATVFFSGERQDMEAYRELWDDLVESGGGVEVNDISDVVIQVAADGKAAISSYFVDNTTRSPDGETSSSRAYETDVWQKIDGEWKIVNLHFSELGETSD